MNPRIDARWAEIDALLDEVLEQPPESRESWLHRHCDDEELRGLVLSLLAADSVRAAELEARAAAAHDWLEARAAELPRIPGYRVLELIGEGGMASVFLAERMLGDTVQRVALKRLRLNVYDNAERRRFEHEHRVLARLEHPNIARLLDAGIAPDGVPWFAMEYVEGEPLVAWCDARRLDTDTRLTLFADICAAVQHAHQHLVVHRDLKPSNILVDGEGRVKLLDFGIARLLDPDTDPPDGTRTELRRLTPGYAAPEQYAGHASTATDLYALGVILVELLSGRKPVPLSDAGSDPLRNATVTREAAEARASSPRALERLLAGDLGVIARKATRSEPTLRYGSAQALADDLAALRTGRPVAARRGDWRYRAACFVRRNRVMAAAVAIIAATLVVTTAISLYQAREARAQAARAQAVQSFVEGMLAPLRIGVPMDHMPRLDEVLAQGVRDLESRRPRDPAVYSELMMMFTATYDRMGDARNAQALADRIHAYCLDAFGPDDPRAVRALALRGITRSDTAAGIADVQAAHARMRRLGIGGMPLVEVLDALGNMEVMAHRPGQSMKWYVEAQRLREDILGPKHPDIAIGLANLGEAQQQLGNRPAARILFEKAYRHSLAHGGAETRQTATYLLSLADLRGAADDWHQGERERRAALDLLDRIAPGGSEEHAILLMQECLWNLVLDDLALAESQCNAAVELTARLSGKDSRAYAVVRRDRIGLLVAQGRLDEARVEGARVRTSLEALPGDAAGISRRLSYIASSDLQYVEEDYSGMRDGLLVVEREGGMAIWPGVHALHLARLALACDHAPAAGCRGDLARLVDLQLARPFHGLGEAIRFPAQLARVRLALRHADAADAHRRLDGLAALAARPGIRLASTHRWLAEARMLRGDAYAAQGEHDAAKREWQAAEAAFAGRYDADHPFRRQLSERLRQPEPAR